MNFRDTFKPVRNTGLSATDGEERIPMLLRYRDVREAARDWRTFSSDAPFRVPIPAEEEERRVRQLPIETDPPVHTALRALVEPFFRRPMLADYQAKLGALVAELLEDVAGKGEVDIVRDFALPLQSRALTYLLGMPEAEAEEWIGWGTHVFRDGHNSSEKGSRLDRYLVRELQAAGADPSREDFFAALTRMEHEGRPLTDDEMLGFANLTFAGGRDTVINSVAVVVDHFSRNREQLETIAESDRAVNVAVEEFVRAITPLTHIGRVCTREVEVDGATVEPDERVSLCWAAANYDPAVFDAPEEVRLDRMPNAHIGFGSGPHKCLGAPQARAILRSLIRGLAAHTSSIEVTDSAPNVERFGEVVRTVGFAKLMAVVHR